MKTVDKELKSVLRQMALDFLGPVKIPFNTHLAKDDPAYADAYADFAYKSLCNIQEEIDKEFELQFEHKD